MLRRVLSHRQEAIFPTVPTILLHHFSSGFTRGLHKPGLVSHTASLRPEVMKLTGLSSEAVSSSHRHL